MVRARRDRGFSLLIVCIIMALLISLAATTLSATQSGLLQSGSAREQQVALNAAEYAVARGKAFIANQGASMYSTTSGWTALLTAAAVSPYLCTPNTSNAASPGVVAPAANLGNLFVNASNAVQSGSPAATWNFCIHNNAEDPGFLDPSGNTPAGTPNGNSSDSRDSQHLIVIEGYGTGPNSAAVRVTAYVGPPGISGSPAPPGDCYSQEGGSAAHRGVGCN